MANCINCGMIVLNDQSKEICLICLPHKEEILKKRKESVKSVGEVWVSDDKRRKHGTGEYPE